MRLSLGYVAPRPDLSRLAFDALPEGLRSTVSPILPRRLYHGTAAAAVFERFDLARARGCAWFASDRPAAEALAVSFSAAGRGPPPGWVYVCQLRLKRIAWFINEDEIRALGGGSGQDSLAQASDRLRALGFDGMADLHNGELAPSFAALEARAVRILQVCRPSAPG